MVDQGRLGQRGGVGIQGVGQVADRGGDDAGVLLGDRPGGLGGGRGGVHRVQRLPGDRGARPQRTGDPYPGYRLSHIDVQQLGQQPGRPAGQQLHRGGAAFQFDDQTVIHGRHPPPLRLQLLEHGEHRVVVNPVQRRGLQRINSMREFGQGGAHGIGRWSGLPVEQLCRTHVRIITAGTDSSCIASTRLTQRPTPAPHHFGMHRVVAMESTE